MSSRWFGPETSLAVLGLAALAIMVWSFRRAELSRAADWTGQGAGPAGLAALAVFGLAAMVLGALALALDYVAVSLPLLAAGFGSWTIVARGHERRGHEGDGVRRVVGLTRAGLSATWLAGLLLLANLFAYRFGDRPIDLSRERIFSLSSLTTNQLAALDRPVTFTAFFGVGPRATPQYERVRELLELYRGAAPRWVTVLALNPFTEPEKFEELARGIPDVALGRGGGVVVQYGSAEAGARLPGAQRRAIRDRPGAGVQPRVRPVRHHLPRRGRHHLGPGPAPPGKPGPRRVHHRARRALDRAAGPTPAGARPVAGAAVVHRRPGRGGGHPPRRHPLRPGFADHRLRPGPRSSPPRWPGSGPTSIEASRS